MVSDLSPLPCTGVREGGPVGFDGRRLRRAVHPRRGPLGGAVGPTLLALDVAFAHVGAAVLAYHEGTWRVLHAEVISTAKETKRTTVRVADDNFRRCQELFMALLDLIVRHRVAAIVAELPSGGSKSAIAMAAMARGAAVFACAAKAGNCLVECTTPGDGKKALGGAANASKGAMLAAALVRFPDLRLFFKAKRGNPDLLENEFEHVADAIGSFCAARGGVAETLVVQLSFRGTP